MSPTSIPRFTSFSDSLGPLEKLEFGPGEGCDFAVFAVMKESILVNTVMNSGNHSDCETPSENEAINLKILSSVERLEVARPVFDTSFMT